MKKLVLLWVVLFLLVFPLTSFASKKKDINIEMSPSVFVVKVQPGELSVKNITIGNKGGVSYEVSIEPIKPNNKVNGLVETSNKKAPDYDAISWLTFGENNFSLPPGKVTEVPIKIKVPKDIPYGQYGVQFIVKPVISTNIIKNIPTILVKSYIDVINPKDIKQNFVYKAVIKDFNYPFYFPGKPVFDLELLNQGNVLLDVDGEVTIKNFFNTKVVAVIPLGRSFVSAGSFIKFSKDWHQWWPGLYNAEATLHYSENKITASGGSFIVIPPYFLIFLIMIIFGIYLMISKSRLKSSRSQLSNA